MVLTLILAYSIGKQEHGFMTKKYILLGCLLYFIFGIIWMIITITLVFENTKHWHGTTEDNIKYYQLRQFEGKMIRKFIDEENHMRKTLVLEQKENGIFKTKKEVFPFDSSGFHEYVVVGDSLVKKEGDLFATVYREGKKDTIIKFRFKNYKTGEVFPKE